jgi:hypothetical protein
VPPEVITVTSSQRAGSPAMPCVPARNPKQKKGMAHKGLDDIQLTRNLLVHGLRCQGERGFALLTRRWAALQHITASPSLITGIIRAALVLTQWEHKYLTQIR